MLAVGDVARIPLPGGDFGAAQVTGIDAHTVTLCALASCSDSATTPLLLDHQHYLGGKPAVANVLADEPSPPGWVWIGNRPVSPGVPATSNVFSGWDHAAVQIVAQRRWDRLPGSVRQAFRKGRTTGEIPVDLGNGPAPMFAARGEADLTGIAAVRWAGLDQLPCCTALIWAGPDRGLAAALAQRPIIERLTWTDAPSIVDLRGTALTSLALGGDIDELLLPDDLTRLELLGDARLGDARLDLVGGTRIGRVTAAGRGRWIRVVAERAAAPDGLDGIEDLLVIGGGTIGVAPLAGLRDLVTLTLVWKGPPGTLTEAETLAGLPRLTRLELTEAYGLEASTLPELPALDGLTVHGLRRRTATGLRARYRRSGVRLAVSGAKNDTWLAANLTNPLRDWVDDHPRAGELACKAYATAIRAIDAAPGPGSAEPILRAFVTKLNDLEAKYEIIDTLRREEACDAFAVLAARAGVAGEQAEAWLDDWRDF